MRQAFGLILVLHWLHMEWLSLPSGCRGINEPNHSSAQHTGRVADKRRTSSSVQVRCLNPTVVSDWSGFPSQQSLSLELWAVKNE